ncbi:FxSxx-COOH system tetratricopeptide repeat protein [Actinoplanes sp. CA-252034]|uniref:FxSxx-COOH system tetratricopeptide repeat protein n=1 Tax=Actinoplanes sp. CA-252034 TaxID=3239906 RepID=UPI003D9957B0
MIPGRTVGVQPVVSWHTDERSPHCRIISVDLRLADPTTQWPYEEEEFLVGCMLDGRPRCTVRALDSAGVILHRFGGTYGPAWFRVEPADAAADLAGATLWLTLTTAGGIPFHTAALLFDGGGPGVAEPVATVRHRMTAVTVRHVPEDAAWAEWITGLLVAAGLPVHDTDGTVLTVISHANAGDSSGAPAPGPPSPAVYVDYVPPLPAHPVASSAFISGQSVELATERILGLFGRSGADVDPRAIGARFPGRPPAVFNVLNRNTRFTGRQEELRHLRSLLRGSAAPAPVAILGMGGIGKTQIALEYAHRFRNAYDVVWWIDAEQTQSIATTLADLGRALDLPAPQSGVLDAARFAIGTLEQGTPYPRWLIVFDTAEDVEGIEPFLPRGPGHVLITSRNREWGERAQQMLIDVFRRHETIAHLTQRVNGIHVDQADRIAGALGDLPIAVAATGAWLAETGEQVDEYLRRIEREGPDHTVDQVWNLSLELLQQRSPAAYRLLQLCSLLAPEISLDLVMSDELAEVLGRYDPEVQERLYRQSLVQHINRLALLKLDQARHQIQLHRLLQHVVRGRMDDQELRQARHEIHLVLARMRPRYEIDDSRSWPRFRMLWPHLEASGAAECDDERVRQLMIERVRYLWYLGSLEEGRRHGERIDRSWTEILDRVDEPAEAASLRRQILNLRFNVANIIRDMAGFEEAYALNRQVLAEQITLLGPAHPHTLMTAGGLAADLRALGRYHEAQKRDELTYAAWMDHFGEDSSRTLAALNNLATTYRLAGDFRQARARDEELYGRNQTINGEDHPRTLGTGTNLGRDLREAGEYQTSAELLEEIARRYARVFGPSSQRTLTARVNWAVSLGALGRQEQSATLLEEAYERLSEMAGPLHPETLTCRLSRACSLLASGRAATAVTELEAVRQAYGSDLGARHPYTLVCIVDLAAAHRAAGDPDRGLALARDAAQELAVVLGTSHPYTLAAQANVAVLRAEAGDPRAAAAFVEPVLRAHEAVLGPHHPDTLRCAANRALMRRAAGEPTLGDGDAVDRLATALGRTHPAVTALRRGEYVARMLDPHPY